ncbi:MAG TPA: hypothetical protein VG248_01925 [Caulobacteraceae bacterium]|nr:hypothetical protein [Caulobacteraceae bacterium]
MSVSAALAASLLAASLQLPFHHHAARDAAAARPGAPTAHLRFRADSRFRVGRWLLHVRRERFTGAETCSVEARREHIERQALVLQFPRAVDTANASYRIDGAAALNVADDRPGLAIQGFQVWKDDLANPSGAVVRVPLSRLSGAQAVRVEPRRNGHVWAFRVEGLSAALAAAKREGCPGA